MTILNLLVWGLSLTVVQTTGTTCDYGTGSIVVTASGGTAPYTYTSSYLGFTTTQSNGSFQNLLSGSYIISVTDLLYQTQNPGDGWDGTIDGKPQPTGAYVWMLKYKDSITGKAMTETGTVLLLR